MSRRAACYAGLIGVLVLVGVAAPGHTSRDAETTKPAVGIESSRRDSLVATAPASVSSAPRVTPIEQRRSVRSAKRFERELEAARFERVQGIRRQLRLVRWRVAFVAVTIGLVLWQMAVPTAASRPRRWRQVAWALLALLSVASFFRFSLTDRIRHDMHIKDVYHYYIGGKYSAEIGYGGLYECTLAAAQERRLWWVDQLDTIRDLQTMAAVPAANVAERAIAECRPRFSDERWKSLNSDLAYFFDRIEGPVWRGMLNDHGFNPTPIWTLIATPITAWSTAEDLPVLVWIDSLLVIAALASIGWAFGFEAMCLAAIVWGTGFLWRYTWVGDAFLRQVWFATAVIGISCIRRGYAFTAGALLAVSAGVRLFPAVFVGGYAVFAIRRFLASRKWSREDRRFAAGVVISAISLILASVTLAGLGFEDYQRFAQNTMALRGVVAKNLAGFEALMWRIEGTTGLSWYGELGTGLIDLEVSTALRVGAAIGSLVWFWIATRDLEAWEAAALGFALIPLLTSPPGYYFHFVVLAVPLWVRRPLVGIWLLIACTSWQINGLFSRDLGEQFTVVSVVAVALSCAVLAAMRGPAIAKG